MSQSPKKLEYSRPAQDSRDTLVAQFVSDLDDAAVAIAIAEGDDAVSAKHFEHAGRLLRTVAPKHGTEAIFGIGCAFLGAGLGTVSTALASNGNSKVVECTCFVQLVIGAVLIAWRWRRHRH